MLKDSDRYLTPSWVFDAEDEYWPDGIDLDPFWDPEGSAAYAKTRFDIRQGEDAYRLNDDDCRNYDNAHFNGPYSGGHPAKTALLVYRFHRVQPQFESVNLCIASLGSDYWRHWVWPLHRMRERGGLVIGWAGRLGFEAAVDIRNSKGELVCAKGVTQTGNRSEIAIVASVDRPRFFADLLRKHSPKPMEVTVL